VNRKSIKLMISLIVISVVSCDEPETVVTNYVHPDGSVTRKIEMRNLENKFDKSGIQVPFDSTWTITDSIEIEKEGDTIWVKRGVKNFINIDEINLSYKADSGANKEISRQTGFRKRFKWFNTEFRFSEKIDKKMKFGYPVSEVLNEEELKYFYSPEGLKHDNDWGPDSLKFRALNDSIKLKTDTWTAKNLVAEWIGAFSELTREKTGSDISHESLKAREDEFVRIIEANHENLDSLWSNGILLREFIGESNALRYKYEADSAVEIAAGNFWVNFKEYSVRILMPGKLIGTNGFIDSSQVLLWPVKSDYFLTEQYEMWAESKISNVWAWVISAIFLVFVLSGVIIRIMKRGS